jgi:septum formation protein
LSLPVILASKSTARRAVLQGAGVPFEIAVSGVDEDVLKMAMLAKGAGPKAIAEALAEEKALAVSRNRAGVVVGADQTLDLEGVLYDKVESLADAAERLKLLRGKPHLLHSAVAAAVDGEIVWRETASAKLTMREFSDAFLDTYLSVEGESALGSVGCYRLEGLGAQLFAAIEGDYFTILGLPLMGLLELLRGRGVLNA